MRNVPTAWHPETYSHKSISNVKNPIRRFQLFTKPLHLVS
ncbi:hypothetical protein LEP1GSC047_0092 [Leptospira inadai serovar Lyme str. 10]|uniref:Uncharacterized protein n=1 Tax=Leptospira inadai serovar Lyme str. 10 TaxID=1049790 RepID=V6HPZ5_9LEPT|nr:hypothetical protein LEP1GSC047_0092 [Leptospira inadai serovar Lyme str. 10]